MQYEAETAQLTRKITLLEDDLERAEDKVADLSARCEIAEKEVEEANRARANLEQTEGGATDKPVPVSTGPFVQPDWSSFNS
jgi:predicted  nucleic acid-binding Zn-ribbon protein